MLVLSRKIGEKVVLGECVTLTVLGIQGDKVRLGFDGPTEVNIRRGEMGRLVETATESDKEQSHGDDPTGGSVGGCADSHAANCGSAVSCGGGDAGELPGAG